MKHLFTAACLLLSSASAMAQGYVVKGTIQGLADGTVLNLIPMSHDNEAAIDSAIVNQGKFEFKGKVDFPRCVHLRVKGAWGGESFMLENANINLQGQAAEPQTYPNGAVSYEINDFKVEGSPLSVKLDDYKQRRERLNGLYDAKNKRFEPLMKKFEEARQAQNQTAVDSLHKSDEYKELEKAEDAFFKEVEKTYSTAINENKDTYWGPLLTLYYFAYLTPDQKDLFASFSQEAQESWYGQKVKSEIFPGGGAGEVAQSFTVKDDAGKEYSLEQLCKGKKYLLIDFWASWCAPCRKEIPNVKAQYAAFKDKGFEVLSISIDQKEAAWKKALADEQLEWPNFLDRTGVANIYQVRSIPAMYLIDAESHVIVASGDEARGEKLAAKLKELLP